MTPKFHENRTLHQIFRSMEFGDAILEAYFHSGVRIHSLWPADNAPPSVRACWALGYVACSIEILKAFAIHKDLTDIPDDSLKRLADSIAVACAQMAGGPGNDTQNRRN